MSKIAVVDKMCDHSPAEAELISKGYTHVVLVGKLSDLEDIVDFKNEFAAHTYADAINMGLVV